MERCAIVGDLNLLYLGFAGDNSPQAVSELIAEHPWQVEEFCALAPAN